jgi:hypothetical protein
VAVISSKDEEGVSALTPSDGSSFLLSEGFVTVTSFGFSRIRENSAAPWTRGCRECGAASSRTQRQQSGSREITASANLAFQILFKLLVAGNIPLATIPRKPSVEKR